MLLPSVTIEIAQKEVKPEFSSCMNSATTEQSLVMVAPQVLFQPLKVAPEEACAVKISSPTVRFSPSIVIVVPSEKLPDRLVSSISALRKAPPVEARRFRE